MNEPKQPSSNLSGSTARSANPPMHKYYVRCGTFTWMVLAADADIAALRFVQNALKGSLISGKKPVNKNLRLVDVEAMKLLAGKLDPRIHISESGFSRSEAGEFVTAVVIRRWRNQVATLENMIRPSA